MTRYVPRVFTRLQPVRALMRSAFRSILPELQLPGSRKTPPADQRAELLRECGYACLYCGQEFGSVVWVPRRGQVITCLEWDHMVPYSWLQANPEHNWAPACHLCNQLKSSTLFESVSAIEDFMRKRWIKKGYTVLWVPNISSELNEDAWAQEYLRAIMQ